jgi:ATP synthase protein I
MPVKKQLDDRSSLALAYEWSARITSISLELVLPVLGGYWLDQRWGTPPLLLIVGVVLGFVTATFSLLRLAKHPDSEHPPE